MTTMRAAAALTTMWWAVRSGLEARVRAAAADERGEIASWVIAVAIFAALAIAVGAIITTKITEKANSIPTS